jgi:hypothetical protein
MVISSLVIQQRRHLLEEAILEIVGDDNDVELDEDIEK